MRICIVSGSFPPLPCGIGDSSKLLADELTRGGHRVTVITSRSSVPPAGGSALGYMVERSVASWGLLGVPGVAGLVARSRPDVVVVQYPTSSYGRQLGIFLLPMALRWGVRRWRVGCVLAIIHEFRRSPLLKRVALAFMIATAQRTLLFREDREAVRQFLPKRLRRITERPPSPASFLDRDVSEQERDEVRQACGWIDGEAFVLHFGFLSPRKGLDVLIGAVAELARAAVQVRLVIVGEAPPGLLTWLTGVRARATAEGLGSRVVWLGYQADDQVVRLLKAADMCVLPFTDGYSPGSASFAQAVACGAATITTQPRLATTQTDRLVDGTNVILVARGETASLSSAIERLIRDPALRDRLRVNVRALSSHPSDTVRALLDAASLVYGGSPPPH